jgi:hypothetical protein
MTVTLEKINVNLLKDPNLWTNENRLLIAAALKLPADETFDIAFDNFVEATVAQIIARGGITEYLVPLFDSTYAQVRNQRRISPTVS